jgi:hypothetical protein
MLLALIGIWTVGFLGANIFQCGTHPAAAWTSGETLAQYCYNTSPATTARMLSNLIIDLMILAAPMPIIWRMQMTVALKIQVTGIFALGFLYVSILLLL